MAVSLEPVGEAADGVVGMAPVGVGADVVGAGVRRSVSASVWAWPAPLGAHGVGVLDGVGARHMVGEMNARPGVEFGLVGGGASSL